MPGRGTSPRSKQAALTTHCRLRYVVDEDDLKEGDKKNEFAIILFKQFHEMFYFKTP